MSMTKRRFLALLGAAPFMASAAVRAEEAPRARRQWATIPPREQVRKRHLPNVELTTHEGKKVRFYDDLMRDKIVAINFMYATCEGICPTVMKNLAKVQARLGDRVGEDIFFYSITLKPQEDTPEKLAAHAAMHGVGKGWYLLTGQPEDIELLRRKLGFVDPDPETDEDTSNHIGNVRYGNEPLMRWGACPGMADPEFIVESILWVDGSTEAATPKGDPT